VNGTPAIAVICVAAAALSACEVTPVEPECAVGEILDASDGEPGVCVPEACGVGPWGDVGDGGDEVRYVAPWGRWGGNGSASDPMDDPSAAWEELIDADGGRMVVAAGHYDDVQLLVEMDGLELRGRCPELVHLTGPDSLDLSVVEAYFGAADLRGVTLSDDSYGVYMTSPALGAVYLDLKDIVIDGCVHGGVFIEGGSANLSIEDSVIRNCVDDGEHTAAGISLLEGNVRVERTRIENNQVFGILANGPGSHLTLIDVDIVDTGDGVNHNAGGAGLVVQSGADATLERVRLLRNGGLGIFVNLEASVDAVDLTIEDTVPTIWEGNGIAIQGGSSVVVEGLTLRRNQQFGIFAVDEGTTLDLRGALVEDQVLFGEPLTGYALQIQDGAVLTGDDITLLRNPTGGLHIAGGHADVTNLVVRDSLAGDFGFGRAIQVDQGGTLVLDGLVAENLIGLGVVGFGLGTTLDLANIEIRDVVAIDGVEGGAGLGVQDQVVLTATNVLVERASGVGLQVEEFSSATLTGVVVRDTAPDGTPDFGRGLSVQRGASATVTGALFENNQDVGVIVNDGATADLTDVIVRGTRPDDDPDSGTGVSIQLGSVVTATDLLVEDSTRSGVSISTAHATLVRTTIRRTRGDATVGLGAGLHVQLGGEAVVEDLIVEDCVGQGVGVGTEGSSLVADGLEVRDTQSLIDGGFGHGVSVVQDAELVVQNGLIEGNHGAGVVSRRRGHATLTDVVIRDTLGGSTEAGGVGVIVQGDGEVIGTDVAIDGGDGPGVFQNSGRFECTDCAVTDSGFAGAVVLDGLFVMEGGSLDGSSPTSDLGGGVGLFAWPFEGADVTLTDVLLRGHPGPAAYLRGPSSYVLDGVEVTDSGTLPFVPGAIVVLEGIEAWDDEGGTGLLVTGCSFDGVAPSALFFDGSGGTIADDNFFAASEGVAVWTQSCESAPVVEYLGDEPSTNACTGAPRDLDPLLIYELELLDMFAVQE